jgi:hypothetical protein
MDPYVVTFMIAETTIPCKPWEPQPTPHMLSRMDIFQFVSLYMWGNKWYCCFACLPHDSILCWIMQGSVSMTFMEVQISSAWKWVRKDFALMQCGSHLKLWHDSTKPMLLNTIIWYYFLFLIYFYFLEQVYAHRNPIKPHEYNPKRISSRYQKHIA